MAASAHPSELHRKLARAVEAALDERQDGNDGGTHGGTARIASSEGVSGGCIHDSRLLELDDGRRFFLKADDVSGGTAADVFQREAEGLTALAAAGALRVPRDPLPGRAGDTIFLIMEAIPTGRPGDNPGGAVGFWEDFGRGFAELHRTTAVAPGEAAGGTAGEAPGNGERPAAFGFQHDNYLGGTPQPNPWSDDWPAFFREHRLGHQLGLARRRGRSTAELERLGERLAERLDDLIDLPKEPGCLLHGDLWSGNFLADDGGAPVILDPAAYFGHRGADLAMTRLFGGFDRRFYAAYEEAWPLPPGSRERREIYQLYHLLNHLNLFGGGYLSQALTILRRYAG